jgi:uracil phosphoribosyltransferase
MAEPRVPGCTVVDHPLVKTKVAVLRNKETSRELFRRTLHELTTFVAKTVTIMPILRAGLGMAEAMLNVLPQARVGHVGMYRDEKTFEPKSYYYKAPPNLPDADIFLVDPMLATGQSASDAVTALKAGGAKRLTLLALVGCVTGAEHFRSKHPDVPIYLAALDEKLNEKAYIVPGLGDAGDRYFGT